MFEESVEILAEMAADALAQHVVQPVEVVLVDQTVAEHAQNLVNPQPGTENPHL